MEPLRSTTLQPPQSLIHHDAHCVREVETSHRAVHRDPEALLRVLLEDACGHPVYFIPEHQHAVVAERRLAIITFRIRGEIEATLARDGVPEREPVRMDPEVHVVPVVEAG